MGLFEDLKKGILEAIAIEKGEIPIIEKENMPATTFVADDMINYENQCNKVWRILGTKGINVPSILHKKVVYLYICPK